MEEQKKNKMEGRISSWHRKLTRYQNYQSDWMEQMRGTLMLVSTVIATMSFQVAINPPGGVWQSDSNTRMGCVPNTTCKAGTSVIAFGSSDQKLNYEIFITLCTISFSASLTIILLLICGFPLSNRLVMWMLMIYMCISVYCTVGAYAISIGMVLNKLDLVPLFIRYYAVYWAGLFVLLCLILFLRFLFYLFIKFLELCLKCVSK
ncbi:putative PGG domain-containing protein [Lupinus albus]|uniref:Putative PGG domain-containing protein n=1 Tax=Lupinus albus TaxID=3870 RepID=A0A6A4R3L1_LUPAL|nr:putative PGG domain-containing protein [Lupinus albus]